ncbi:transcriptional regulator, MarR family [Catenulispora acidiphila DSM 44928]|uniref:Transcriptional regulator, MarR family n=1 Tax=Catenulispora acidiphila (strain DSM 44928 / JCM 14897 / NBRC 102108 / NRRL B-24433 / ID139908) TaxID=479433 RepID=C7QCN6_CATAD|nr:MarR family transcriptional regulator [Catenulispora acidiphila]ACU76499.1 transcriptional regulator, MarR family [Catenulispora acidiphila DSM 44928]
MPEEPLPPEELAARLAEIYLLVGPLYRRVLRKVELGEEIEGIGVGVRAVLDMLRLAGPMTVPQMGRAQALSRQFVQRTVNDAAARGLVEAVPNPAHRRSSLIRLTDPGRAAIEAVIARERGLLGQVGGALTRGDVDACVKVLSSMLAAVSDVEVDGE